jgi:hypothetical protein
MKRLSFNEEMMKAWLEGRKTVTRRLMKPQPIDADAVYGFWYPKPDSDRAKHYVNIKHFRKGVAIDFAPYSPGETVFIGESKAIIKSIRPERVQEINNNCCMTDADTVKEGCPGEYIGSGEAEVTWFRRLWDSLYPGSWERNDWCWVIELERVG